MANAQAEPSMDEILASIRRIISEDDQQSQADSAAQKLDTLDLRHDSADLSAEEEAASPAAPEPAEVVDVADEDAFAAVAAALDEEPVAEQPVSQVSPEPSPETALEVGFAQEAEAVFEAESPSVEEEVLVPAIEPEVQVPSIELEQVEMETVASLETQEPTLDRVVVTPRIDVSSVEEEVAPVSAPVSAPVAIDPEAFLAPQTESAAASAFEALNENIRISSGQGRTLEDTVEQLLAPMLKQWLDQNLSRIVEEKVEDEVRRIARRRS